MKRALVAVLVLFVVGSALGHEQTDYCGCGSATSILLFFNNCGCHSRQSLRKDRLQLAAATGRARRSFMIPTPLYSAEYRSNFAV